MKIVIPVAGVGSRLRPHTHSTPKVLLNVAGKKIIQYILDDIKVLNPEEIIFIIGYLGDNIKEFLEDNYDYNMTFIRQTEFNGLGHAISLAKDQVNGSPLLIILGDTITKVDYKAFVSTLSHNLGVKAVEDPRRFGIVELDGKRVTKLVEKPEHPSTNLAIIGLYWFPQSTPLFKGLDHIIQNNIRTRNEFQITDAMQHMIEKNEHFTYMTVNNWWDCGKKETLLQTNMDILNDDPARFKVKKQFDNAVIIEPVSIHDSAVIRNSVIGPYVSIASEANIENSIIRNTLVGRNSTLTNVLLNESIIGDEVMISDTFKNLNIGPDSEIIFK